MSYYTLESWLAELEHEELRAIWKQLKLDESIGPAKGRPCASLARDIVGFYDTETLSHSCVRSALLYAFEKPAVKLCQQHDRVSRRMKDWPDKLYPVWRRGSLWAHRFCKAFEIDPIYAGSAPLAKPPVLEHLEPPRKLSKLLDFQQDLSRQILSLLQQKPPMRGMASLPTGAGKTRTAIEAVLRFQAATGGIVLWIATTNEICEQAASTYKAVYQSMKPEFEGKIHRFWGSYTLQKEFDAGFMVAGVQKLARLNPKDAAVKELFASVSAVIFDEAHHAVAPTYKKLVKGLVGTIKAPTRPLVGLTATPGRGVTSVGASTKELVRAFDRRLLTPERFKNKNPVKVLQDEGILSRIEKKRKQGIHFSLSKAEQDYIEQFGSFSPRLLDRVGKVPERNKIIIEQITRDPTEQQALVFACDVRQAEALAYQWRARNVSARAITATTHQALRRRWIHEFSIGKLRVLVNVGTLTTGFDAPIVRRVIMARPTTSPILFEQMIGRGLRGPKFGGTKKCTIVDIVDSFELYGSPQSFTRFERDWMHGKR
ncbi:DEAD/DEAH box helicase family protein [Coraliomargarita sp. SDUM461004]|uniref:DEAD/DEAH box helicase family protein n=1 Tax=Thalassobacterium sedimentorum TaxID=3041258 RepID=A0ABU1AKA7_9BACT|nr:DEAD/DEAH box helicase family protein [Coraliomargarita sp. SDUM461004]MDQ8194033.1 DEAD/DEAH box helicase family protein [Coraliomargarita sp. SDUM461004]